LNRWKYRTRRRSRSWTCRWSRTKMETATQGSPISPFKVFGQWWLEKTVPRTKMDLKL